MGPLGPRTIPVSKFPRMSATSTPPTSAERTSTTSASSLEIRPRAHCGTSFPLGGPVTSSLYTSERTAIEHAPCAALFAHVGDPALGGCAQPCAPLTRTPAFSRD